MKASILWHPESPGMKVAVVRSWWQRCIYPKEFATLNETIKDYKLTLIKKMG